MKQLYLREQIAKCIAIAGTLTALLVALNYL